MAYSNGYPDRTEGPTYCDPCAEGEYGAPPLVPFEWCTVQWGEAKGERDRWQLRPWCWCPRYGGACEACGDPC